jgi:programmed cell death protein 5
MEGDLDEIRKRKLAELQQGLAEQKIAEEQAAQIDVAKRQILMSVLTPAARNRLANIKLARPDFAAQIENLLIQLAQSGQLAEKIDDKQLKQILLKIQNKKRDIKIKKI